MEVSEQQPLQSPRTPRNRIYNLGESHFEYRDDEPCERSLPWAPPRHMIFELTFFRRLYDHLVSKSLRQDIPLMAIRNMSFKLMNGFSLPGALKINFFGHLQKEHCSWEDIQSELIQTGHPRIELSPAERIYLTLSQEDSSRVAKGWFYFVMIVTVANMSKIMFPELAGELCAHIGLDNIEDGCTETFNTCCIVVFSLDYFTKLICSPFVRMHLIEASAPRFCSDSIAVERLSTAQRVQHFALQGEAIIDLVAILPWWLEMSVGNFLPGASFLRVIRLARLMRIFKSAKYLDMVQVLGLTLWKSMVMVAYLFSLIAIISLIAGCLLHQCEHKLGEPVFQTVPASTYWIFTRFIGMADTPNRAGKVQSHTGIAVLSVKIFTKEYNQVTRERELRMSVREAVLDATAVRDSKLLISPKGVICGRLCMGEMSAQVPLPLQQTSEISKARPLEIQLPLRYKNGARAGSVQLCMWWKPGPQMQSDALPTGDLGLSLMNVTVKGGPAPTLATWEVPVQAFGVLKREVKLNESTERSFEIRWEGEAGTESKVKEKIQPFPVVKDFQERVISLLHEQGRQLRRQEDLLSEHAAHLKAL